MDLSCFLDTLPRQKTGTLLVAGMAGSGKSRFLAETRKIVQLRGYMTLTLEATAASKTRLYGVVAEAQGGWTELASPISGKESFSASAKRILEEREANGLVILVDDLPELDRATLRFLRDMLLSNDLPQFALIYTTDPYHSLKGPLSATPLQASIIMQPLSQEAIHIWLRDSLHWEASLDFVAWFHRETTGLPADIECGLGYLIEHGILQQPGASWVCRPDLDNIPLAAEIKKATAPPSHNLPRYATDFIVSRCFSRRRRKAVKTAAFRRIIFQAAV